MIWLAILGVLSITTLGAVMVFKGGREDMDKIERINDVIYRAHAESAGFRDRQEARLAELVDLLNETGNEYAIDELSDVIYDGADFGEALRRIQNFKYHNYKNG